MGAGSEDKDQSQASAATSESTLASYRVNRREQSRRAGRAGQAGEGGQGAMHKAAGETSGRGSAKASMWQMDSTEQCTEYFGETI